MEQLSKQDKIVKLPVHLFLVPGVPGIPEFIYVALR